MKKILILLMLVVSFLCSSLKVNALEYNVKELISVDDVATVSTERFTYQDFKFNIENLDKGNITFSNIINNTDKEVPISINVLLFDKNETNIGYVTYCTDKDLSSENTYFKLPPNGNSFFSINISKKYFIEEKTIRDVMYIAVLDENKYCHIGGYGKYQGLTIKDIKEDKVAADITKKSVRLSFLSFINNKKTNVIILGIVSLLSLSLVIGSILNALYKRMFSKITSIAYIPIFCNYVAVKLAFGSLISIIYLILLFISTLLLFKNIMICFIILNIIALGSFLIVIFKLVTKNYYLFVFKFKDMEFNSKEDELVEYKSTGREDSSLNDSIDLSYDNDLSSDGLESVPDISLGRTSSSDDYYKEENDVKNNSNNLEEESDLSKFFR